MGRVSKHVRNGVERYIIEISLKVKSVVGGILKAYRGRMYTSVIGQVTIMKGPKLRIHVVYSSAYGDSDFTKYEVDSH